MSSFYFTYRPKSGKNRLYRPFSSKNNQKQEVTVDGQVVKPKHETSYVVVLPLLLNQREVCLRTDGNNTTYRIPCSRTINHAVNASKVKEIAVAIAKKLGTYRNLQFCYVFRITPNDGAVEKVYFFVCELTNEKNSTKKVRVPAQIFLYRVALCTLSKLVRAKLIEKVQQFAEQKKSA